MKKMIKNVFLFACTVGVVMLIPVFLSHDTPFPVELVQLDAEAIAAKKEAASQAARKAQQKERIRRVHSCQTDEDCIIVDKDPCGCAAGPEGVVAINVNYITDFQKINKTSGFKACPEIISRERECSPSARGVCKANACKIAY